MKTSGVILGVGAPNDSVKHGKTMCAIVLTADLGMIRIYPVSAQISLPVWGEVSLEIERGGDDRSESYRLRRFSLTGKIENAEEKRELLDACVIKSGQSDPIDYQNNNRASVVMIKPAWGDCEFSISQKVPKNIPEDDEECGWIVTQGRHWQKPYVTWRSAQGGEHKSHLGGREIYECIRRNPESVWNLMNNLRVSDPDYEFWMLMGNMKNRRNVWLCVHLHRLKKTSGVVRSLFPHRLIGSDGWPYQQQEAQNIRMDDGHPLLFDTANL